MKKVKVLSLLLGLCLFLSAPGLVAQQRNRQERPQIQQRPGTPGTSMAEAPKPKPQKFEAPATTSGSVSVEGQRVAYKAVAGVMPILNVDETDTTARMSYVAYFKDGVTDLSTRPITFLYNGGPGSSTLWLHMGSFGPRRVVIDSTTHMHGAPYQLVNNEYSLLDASDLVFIDAPGTGFGRVEKGKESDYFGVDQDANAFAQFIQNFITQYNRWNSPKFLFGESYGTLRSALLASVLQGHSIDVNGVILLSQILNYGNSVDGPSRDPGNNKPYELALPTYAATAWYHHKLPSQPADLKSFLSQVEKYAMTDYAQALDQGGAIDAATLDRVANQLHQYTGLPVDYIRKAGLRIDGGEFRQQLLLGDDEATGRLDTRFTGPIQDPLAQRSFGDPQSNAISGAYVALLNDYMRNTLNYGKNMDYRPNVYGRTNWDMKHRGSGTVNVMPDLASAMKSNPTLQVMLNAGYFDLATPFYEGVYELKQLPMPASLQKNIHFAFYQSGHMVYVNVPALKQMHDNVKKFIDNNYNK